MMLLGVVPVTGAEPEEPICLGPNLPCIYFCTDLNDICVQEEWCPPGAPPLPCVCVPEPCPPPYRRNTRVQTKVYLLAA
jgi:hypothetical protein